MNKHFTLLMLTNMMLTLFNVSIEKFATDGTE